MSYGGIPVNDAVTVSQGSWRELLGAKYVGVSSVLSGGVALYATNEFLTTSLMPSAIADIGGERLYAWVATVYLVASVASATMVDAVLRRLGPRSSYLLGFTLFGVGSIVCALAPTMPLLLTGRVVQGVAGGLLTGLAYAVINVVLPERLWTRASALVSAMWGIGTLLGPAAGGLFAQLGLWRSAFHVLAVLALVIAVVVPVAIPGRPHHDSADGEHPAIPGWSVLILATAVLAVSVASIPSDVWTRTALVSAFAVLLAVFVVVDRRSAAAVLPASVFCPGPLKWIFVSLGVLMGMTMVDMYVPLFGQRLADLTPVAAGFLGATLAIGWTAAELASASASSARLVARLVRAAPFVMVSGLALCAVAVTDSAGPTDVILLVGALLLTGVGVGIAWPHLSAWAMSLVDDPAEGPVAAAAVNITQLICGAFGAGLAGVVVNSTGGDIDSARWLFVVFAVIAGLGTVATYRATLRGTRREEVDQAARHREPRPVSALDVRTTDDDGHRA